MPTHALNAPITILYALQQDNNKVHYCTFAFEATKYMVIWGQPRVYMQ